MTMGRGQVLSIGVPFIKTAIFLPQNCKLSSASAARYLGRPRYIGTREELGQL